MAKLPRIDGFTTMRDVEKRLGVGRKRIIADVEAGKLPAHKQGKYWYFRVKDIDAYEEYLKPKQYSPDDEAVSTS